MSNLKRLVNDTEWKKYGLLWFDQIEILIGFIERTSLWNISINLLEVNVLNFLHKISGVALLLNGLRSLRHVVYDVMSDVLTYIDFNTSDLILPKLELRTVLFHSMELLSSNHLELVSKLCPYVEWLSLDSALFYNLEGLSRMPQLRLLRLNYKG